MQPPTKPTLLLIEDNPGDARLIREFLAGSEFVLQHADLLADGIRCVAGGGIALVLLDLSLPDSSGPITFTRIHSEAPEIPIIVLSGRDDEALAIATVQEGAQDYLVKGPGLNSHLLVRAIRYAIERKRAEEALARERDLLHMLLQNLPDRIYFKDAHSRFLRISRAVAEQFKVSHAREAIGKTDFDFFTAEHAIAARKDEEYIMATGQAIIGKIEKETLPDDRITWALTSKLPFKDKHGRIVGTFGISRDITDLKNFEEALAAERNLLRNLIDNLPDYIYVKDTRGRYALNNSAHQRFLGVTSQEGAVGKTSDQFFPPEVAALFAADDGAVLQDGQTILNREERIQSSSGTDRWHSTTKVPLRHPDGTLLGLVGISRDITERKEWETRLQQANAELASKQDELQRALAELQKSHAELKSAQYQLIQAEKMQSLGRLAAGVAHEVKNPLAIVGMGVEYLSKNLVTSDENVTVILGDMTQALSRADRIIRGMLDFSIPRALDLRAENLNEVIDQALMLIRHEMASNRVVVRKEFMEPPPPVLVDKNKIQQVFLNLLTNAVQAMPNGGTLTLRTTTRELLPEEVSPEVEHNFGDRFRAGQTVLVAEVHNSGESIPTDKLAKVFDPFFSTKPAGKGTGLGLTVARKIVELHGANIQLRNHPDGGVVVTLWFKL